MNEAINMKFTVPELNLILEALGGLAYYRVHEVIHNIHSQAQEQVSNISSGQAGKNGEPSVKTNNGVPVEQ